METTTQPTPLTRIALGALDVNKHLNSPIGSPKKSPVKKAGGFVFTDSNDAAERTPGRSLKEQLLEVEVERQTPVRVLEIEAPRNEKRKEAPTEVTGREEEGVKVARREGSVSPARGALGEEVGSVEGDEVEATQPTRTHSASPSAALDPSLSLSHTSADTVPNSPAPANTTETELRENASALRLRLKFAMYKLKTNQHDIPLSRLELLSSVPKRHATTPPRASAASPSHSEGGSVTPKPQQRQLLDAAPVSPSPAENDGGVVEMLTPLPGHMQMVGEDELTSSGVKGVAADGLLSLMGVRD
ncbi:hypothetical protein O988_07385 [Pseudogymnoascus sp. VKM F-3808]|nr:hypothetical protein O988_07385 [Pseudogymnoascus sp. VKM F-3808]